MNQPVRIKKELARAGQEAEKDQSHGSPAPGEIDLINQQTRRKLSAAEVFVFSVVLCDNEIDRDFERFTIDALHGLSRLFVGKTGIFDHSMKGRDQLARIFSCQVEEVPGRMTAAKEPYHRLKARAYLPRISKNEEMILEIDAGIKKEVSVGSPVCSVCGAPGRGSGCAHVPGREYACEGETLLCHTLLRDPTDAFEWSFVAVPAQRGAGVVKSMSPAEPEAPASRGEAHEAGEPLTGRCEKHGAPAAGSHPASKEGAFSSPGRERAGEDGQGPSAGPKKGAYPLPEEENRPGRGAAHPAYAGAAFRLSADFPPDVKKSLLQERALTGSQCEALFGYLERLAAAAEAGERYRGSLRQEVLRLSVLCHPELPGDTVKAIAQNLSMEELERLRDAYRASADKIWPAAVQLPALSGPEERLHNQNFMI